jgi:acetoin utilization protein AcuB
MKQMPKIEKVMTPMPHTIGATISLARAVTMMREYQVRHLPVQEGGKLVGVLTDRDVKLVLSLQGADRDTLKVEDAMTPEPYCVTPQTPIDHVTDEMAEHKYGCVIVQQENGKVVGIFTATDALRFLGEKMKEHYKQAG